MPRSGYGHEHNRPDRDKAIKIHWKMVNETKRQYLIKYKYGIAESEFFIENLQTCQLINILFFL